MAGDILEQRPYIAPKADMVVAGFASAGGERRQRADRCRRCWY